MRDRSARHSGAGLLVRRVSEPSEVAGRPLLAL